jgi:hypothetical protein
VGSSGCWCRNHCRFELLLVPDGSGTIQSDCPYWGGDRFQFKCFSDAELCQSRSLRHTDLWAGHVGSHGEYRWPRPQFDVKFANNPATNGAGGPTKGAVCGSRHRRHPKSARIHRESQPGHASLASGADGSPIGNCGATHSARGDAIWELLG